MYEALYARRLVSGGEGEPACCSGEVHATPYVLVVPQQLYACHVVSITCSSTSDACASSRTTKYTWLARGSASAPTATVQDAAALLPAGITEQKIETAVEQTMRTMDWDELTVKKVSAEVAAQALRSRCPGPRARAHPAIPPPQLLSRELTEAEDKPWRKVVKAAINTCTPRIKAERAAERDTECVIERDAGRDDELVAERGGERAATGAPERRAEAASVLTPAEARRQAEAEGLTLVASRKSSSGFKCVSRLASGSFQAQRYDSRAQKNVYLGSFATAEEAALAVARADKAAGGDGARRAEAEQHRGPSLTPAEARRQAEAEGLTLVTSSRSASGFKYVERRSKMSVGCAGFKVEIGRAHV